MNKTVRERLMSRIAAKGRDDCWLWTGGKRANGYGTFAIRQGEQWSQTTAHRAVYEEFLCTVPDGYEVDHLCHNRACCNPRHLEAITLQENRNRRNIRKTHCIHGHKYTPENTRMQRDSDGYSGRVCRVCENSRHQKYYQERKS